jgi:alpha-L-fucosidase
MGAWLKVNGEAIYSTRPLKPYEEGDLVFTRKKDGAAYCIVLAKDDVAGLPETVTLPAEIAARVKSAKMLGYGPLKVDGAGGIAIPKGYRAKSGGGLAWAIKLEGLGP